MIMNLNEARICVCNETKAVANLLFSESIGLNSVMQIRGRRGFYNSNEIR